jgi:chaperonin GroES
MIMASLKPLRDKIVVERSEAEEKTAGGIVLPGTAQDKPKQGTVISVGSGRVLDNGTIKALEVKKGDRVLFGGYAGSEVKIEGKEFLILAESEVLAVIENGKK